MNTDQTLNDRQGKYGEYITLANIAQTLKEVMRGTKNWDNLDDDMKETLDMNATKTARILNGDPEYVDNWHDIAGYIRLVERRLDEKKNPNGKQNTPDDPLRHPYSPKYSGETYMLTNEEYGAILDGRKSIEQIMAQREGDPQGPFWDEKTLTKTTAARREDLIQQLTKLRAQLLQTGVSEKSYQEFLPEFEEKHG